MKTQRYPKYKESGVEWLGEVPSHWEVVQSRRYFSERKERALPTDAQLTASQKYGILPQEKFMELEDQRVMQVVLGADILKHVEPNDFVISMRSFQGGLEWSPIGGCISSAYVMLAPSDKIFSRFFYYLFKSSAYIQELQATTNLVRDGQALRFANFVQVALPLMPKAEQSAIAAFLDRETRKIDALISDQEKLIELLREKRQAVISHAVIKGIDPAAPMKDSGIEWLGEIPSHWTIKTFQRCVAVEEGLIDPEQEPYRSMDLIAPNHVESGTGRLLALETSDEQGAESGKYTCKSGDVIYSKIRPALRKVTIAPHDCLCSADMYPMSGHSGMSNHFLYWSILSERFSELATLESQRVAMPKINRESLKNITFALPSLPEQSLISSFLDRETSKIDALTTEAKRAIDLLKERRAALISTAVLGKIDVRHHSAQIIRFTPRERRNILAAKIISQCHLDQTFGRTKAQKTHYLLENYLGIEEMGGQYERNAAGPYDRVQMESIAVDLHAAEWFQEVSQEDRYVYRPLPKAGEIDELFEKAWADRRAEINALIRLLRPLDTREAEVVATLFAAWNDFLLEGQVVDDETLITEARTNWHPSKILIPIEKWRWGLSWMRKNSIVPRGTGRRTIYQTSLL